MIPAQLFMKVLARVDAKGRIQLPSNLRRALGIKSDHVLELATVGRGRTRRLMVLPRSSR